VIPKKELKVSYEFVGQDSGEGRIERAFDMLFDAVLEAETKERDKSGGTLNGENRT